MYYQMFHWVKKCWWKNLLKLANYFNNGKSDIVHDRNTFPIAQISLKNKLNSVKTFHIGLGNMSWNAKGISLCIKTWQSWLFIPYIFPLSRLMQSWFFSCFICPHTFLWSKFKAYVAFGFSYFSFSTINYNLGRLHINFKSCLAFALSFVLSFMSITVLSTFSNTFFSTCIASKLCRIRLVEQ